MRFPRKYFITVKTAKKRYGFTLKKLKEMEARGWIEIQQSGYPSDSTNHKKFIIEKRR